MMTERVERKLHTAEEMIRVAEVNAQYEFWNSAVNRLYYACFHAVDALLTSKGFDASKTHAGLRTAFSLHVIKEGIMDKEWSYFYSSMFDSRSDADYDDFVEHDREAVEEMLPKTKEFVSIIKELITK